MALKDLDKAYPGLRGRLEAGEGVDVLAEAYGVGKQTIKYAARRWGIQGEAPVNPQVVEILRRCEAGETYRQVAEAMGVTRQRVQQIASRAGIERRSKISESAQERRRESERRAQEHRQARAKMYSDVRELVHAGLADKEICERLGLSYNHFFDLRRRIGLEGGVSATRRGRYHPLDMEGAYTLWREGADIEQVAAVAGTTSTAYLLRSLRRMQRERDAEMPKEA